jgi:hypothetical protein
VQLFQMEALEQQVPYFRSSDADSSAEQQWQRPVPALLAAALQQWRALRAQRKRVWGEERPVVHANCSSNASLS